MISINCRRLSALLHGQTSTAKYLYRWRPNRTSRRSKRVCGPSSVVLPPTLGNSSHQRSKTNVETPHRRSRTQLPHLLSGKHRARKRGGQLQEDAVCRLSGVGTPQAASVVYFSGTAPAPCSRRQGQANVLIQLTQSQDDYKYLSSDDQLASQGRP